MPSSKQTVKNEEGWEYHYSKGKLMVEYRKTGLLTETVDDKGVSTYFDYDPKFRPSRRLDWEPKPLRVREGNRRKSEIIAEYVYSDDGKVVAAKDRHGDLTRYSYTARGEIATVTCEGDAETWLDAGYVGPACEAVLAGKGIQAKICEKGARNRPLTAKQKRSNRAKSRKRCRVEHVFGYMTMNMKAMVKRYIGLKTSDLPSSIKQPQ